MASCVSEMNSTSVCVLHFLADGRVGGPQVRVVRVHLGMNSVVDGVVETIVACPLTQPSAHFDRQGMRHVEMLWNKPKAEYPLRSGLEWLFSGLWKDVAASRKIMRGVPAAIVHVNGAILLAAVVAAILEKRLWVWHLNDTSVPRFLALIVRALLWIGGGRPLAASQAVVAYYHLPVSTEICYPPVPLPKVRSPHALDATPIKLGVMANLSPGKGVENVIEAFAVAYRRNTNLSLLIAGRVLENKRWYFEALQQRIVALGLEGKVVFSGFVSEPLAWMSELDVFLFASFAEAAPVAVIEALACGLPIVCGDIPPTREILGGCGLLTPLGDSQAMADAICKIVENESVRENLSAQAYERARLVFSVEVIARQYCQFYTSLLKENR